MVIEIYNGVLDIDIDDIMILCARDGTCPSSVIIKEIERDTSSVDLVIRGYDIGTKNSNLAHCFVTKQLLYYGDCYADEYKKFVLYKKYQPPITMITDQNILPSIR